MPVRVYSLPNFKMVEHNDDHNDHAASTQCFKRTVKIVFLITLLIFHQLW